MIDIAMLVCNRPRITEIAIRELKARTTTPHRLIVLDNGSESETLGVLCGLANERLIDALILSERNYGVHWGHNELLNFVSSGPYYVSTDNDLVPCAPTEEGDWLSRLVDLANLSPDYAAIACRPHVLIGEGANLFDDAPEIKERGHVGAHLRLMFTQATRYAGWDKSARRPSRNNEERWICKGLKAQGYKVGYARDIRCIHLFGETELGEDPWGYEQGSEHGHREVSPPVNVFAWDRQGVDWQTCQR